MGPYIKHNFWPFFCSLQTRWLVVHLVLGSWSWGTWIVHLSASTVRVVHHFRGIVLVQAFEEDSVDSSYKVSCLVWSISETSTSLLALLSSGSSPAVRYFLILVYHWLGSILLIATPDLHHISPSCLALLCLGGPRCRSVQAGTCSQGEEASPAKARC